MKNFLVAFAWAERVPPPCLPVPSHLKAMYCSIGIHQEKRTEKLLFWSLPYLEKEYGKRQAMAASNETRLSSSR